MNKDLTAVDNALWNRFATPLWSDVASDDEYYNRKPHLAHYTSIANVENILRTNELWFANPLYMNDYEEIRFGINQGLEIVTRSVDLRNACGTSEHFRIFVEAFEARYHQFAFEHAVDTYVFCLSELDPNDNDGLLSMWRGYGGNGSGVALVVDAGKIEKPQQSTLVFARVHYDTTLARRTWVEGYVKRVAALLSQEPVDAGQLSISATALFERIKVFALFTKHKGFEEEREWRIVYIRNRDREGGLVDRFGYSVGARGIEPRLRFKVAPTDGVTAGDFTFERITDRIILGPTSSSPLSLAAFQRLLDATHHSDLKARVRASTIPFRDR